MNKDAAAVERSSAEIWTLDLALPPGLWMAIGKFALGKLSVVSQFFNQLMPRRLLTFAYLHNIAAELGREGRALKKLRTIWYGSAVAFLQHEDLGMPRVILVLETPKRTKSKPSTWLGRKKSLFQLHFCLEVL